MCCYTHQIRDEDEKPPLALMAQDRRFRCQCKYGQSCDRAMTAEDLLCDWCRGSNHDKVCHEQRIAASKKILETLPRRLTTTDIIEATEAIQQRRSFIQRANPFRRFK